MSTTVKAGWLKDSQGNKFAPKTMSSQVITDDGVVLEDKINEDLANLETSVKEYTDTKVADLVNSAPETLDTLGELAVAMAENESIIDALNEAITSKSDVNHNHDDSYYTKEQVDNMVANVADVNSIVDLTSEQTITGVKTFSEKIKIGGATLSYDSTNKRIAISFAQEEAVNVNEEV